MYVSINSKNEIKEVGISTNPNLTSVFINDKDNPFEGWSDAKICCYKVKVSDGIVIMMTPYVDSTLIDHIDQLGQATPYTESKKAYIDDTECIFTPNKKGMIACSVITDSGKPILCNYTIVDKSIVIRFERLEEVATVNISIQ